MQVFVFVYVRHIDIHDLRIFPLVHLTLMRRLGAVFTMVCSLLAIPPASASSLDVRSLDPESSIFNFGWV
jgi:hypothetical protein